jgi:hypothetical protein
MFTRFFPICFLSGTLFKRSVRMLKLLPYLCLFLTSCSPINQPTDQEVKAADEMISHQLDILSQSDPDYTETIKNLEKLSISKEKIEETISYNQKLIIKSIQGLTNLKEKNPSDKVN